MGGHGSFFPTYLPQKQSNPTKAKIKRRTSHEPNGMLMKLNEGEKRVFSHLHSIRLM